MKFSMNKLFSTLAVGAAMVTTANAQRMYTASLDTTQAHPAITSSGSGTAWVSFDASTSTITYEVTVANLTGSISSAHIHLGAAGTSGPVYQAITFTGNTATGSITGVHDTMMLHLFKGNLYFNIHTASNAGGEIRGQINRPAGRAFRISADASQLSPAPSSTAKGTGWAVLDSTGTVVNYKVTYNGLSGAPTSAHFHDGATGVQSGSVINTITGLPATANGSFSGSWTGLTNLHAAKLIKDGVYLNIHTSANAGGEIRGQVLRVGKIMLSATLNGTNQVPLPVVTNGKAQWYGILDPATSTLEYQWTYAQQSSAVTAAHYHRGNGLTSGPVVAAITTTGGRSNAGTWSAIPDTTMGDLVQRMLYINVHTTNNSGGEIRGQINHKWGAFFTIGLDGAQSGTGAAGTGTGWATMDAAGNFNYWITVAGLTGAIQSAHLHEGAPAVSGGVATTLTFVDSTAIGTGTPALTDAFMISALKDNTYVNIHTVANAGGEIRGQAWLNKIGTVVGIRQVLQTNQLRVFPNPATDNVQVEIPNAINEPAFVQFFDISGKIVSSQQLNLTQGLNTISVQELPTGVYMLMIRTEKQAIGVQKVVKQ